MAYDEAIADRVGRLLGEDADVVEKSMIGGGVGFMIDGHLVCGVRTDGLTVGVGPDARTEVLATPHVRPLVLGRREPAAFVVVGREGLRDDEVLWTA